MTGERGMPVREVPGWRLNEAGRLIVRWGRHWLDLTGEDIERGTRAVRSDPVYRSELATEAKRYFHHNNAEYARVIAAEALLDAQPLPRGRRCSYTFPLPSWAGEDQMDPCRCTLHHAHRAAGTDHECEHTRLEKVPPIGRTEE